METVFIVTMDVKGELFIPDVFEEKDDAVDFLACCLNRRGYDIEHHITIMNQQIHSK